MSRSLGVAVAGVVLAVLSASSCGRCLLYCAQLQSLEFQSAAGTPLTPLEVTDGSQTYRCVDEGDGGTVGFGTTCTGTVLRYDMRTPGPHRIRAVATTGEVFDGEITPVRTPGEPAPADGCSCGTQGYQPLAITLR